MTKKSKRRTRSFDPGSCDKRRLRGLTMDAVLLVRRKPISGKESMTIEWPHQIARAQKHAVDYGRSHPSSYQPAYRVNIYPKGFP